MARLPIDKYAQELCAAVEAYNFPPETYDFQHEPLRCYDCDRVVKHEDMLEVERFIREQLLSTHLERVKDGLSNVLFWGYAREPGRRLDRVRRFRCKVTCDKLKTFTDVVDSLRGPGLRDIGRIRLPEFSMMPFVSKIRMFLCPGDYPVLDNILARKFGRSDCFLPLRSLVILKSDTSIRITESNEQVYEKWACWCRETAQLVNAETSSPCKNLRAVDVERAIFQLAQADKDRAWLLLQGPQT